MRDRETRALAALALERLLDTLGTNASEVTVLGGLDVDLLTESTTPPHAGTVDIDVLLDVGFVYERDERDFGWLERALRAAGYESMAGDATWRWSTQVGGAEIVIDLLCDTPDSRGQQIVLPGCPTATANNLQGPGSAALDAVPRELAALHGELRRSGPTDELGHVEVRFAGLGGYLLAKAAAVLGRRADKDVYDFVYVLIHNVEGGPEAAAAAVARLAARAPGRLPDFRAVLQRLVAPGSQGPDLYADQRVRDGDPLPADRLAEDAVSAALAALHRFDELTGRA